jgi:hypothetical protein
MASNMASRTKWLVVYDKLGGNPKQILKTLEAEYPGISIEYILIPDEEWKFPKNLLHAMGIAFALHEPWDLMTILEDPEHEKHLNAIRFISFGPYAGRGREIEPKLKEKCRSFEVRR